MRKIKYIVFILIGLLGFQNCARVPGFSSGGSGDVTSASTNDPNDLSTAIQAPYAILIGEQVLKGMLNTTGLTTVPASVTTEYNSRKGVYAITPDLKSTTSPMIVGITSLGGEICSNLVTTEKAAAATARNYFSAIDFTKNAAAISSDQYDSVIRAFARNFWGRNETLDERQALISGKADFIASIDTKITASSTADSLLLFTCAAMLASFDAITY